MKKLLMVLALSAFSFAVLAQTSTDSSTHSTQGTSTDIMGAQEEVYPEGPGSSPGSSPSVQEEETVDDPMLREDSSTIQEEVESDSEETMRSDTMDGSSSMEGTTPQGSQGSEGSSTP